VKWTFQAGGPIETTPILAYGMVFVGGGGVLHAIDAVTGQERWKLQIGGILKTPAIADGVVYVGAGALYAIDALTGQELWSYRDAGEIEAPPTVEGNYVYFSGGSDQNVYALDRSTQTLRWEYENHWKVLAPLAIEGGTLVHPAGWDTNGLDLGTGDERWSTSGTFNAAAPAIADGVVYLPIDDSTGFGNGRIVAVGVESGAQHWEFNLPRDKGQFATSAAVAGGMVYAADTLGVLHAIDGRSGGIERWTFVTGSVEPTAPSVAGLTLFIGSGTELLAIDRVSGAKRWSHRIGAAIGHSPTIVDGVVYVGAADGRVHAIGGDGGIEPTAPPEASPVATVSFPVVFAEGDPGKVGLQRGPGPEGEPALRWQLDVTTLGLGPMIGSVAAAGDVVLFTAGIRDEPATWNLVAVDAETAAEAWRVPGVSGRLTVVDDVVYAVDEGFWAIDLTTHSVLWEIAESELGRGYKPAAAFADGFVYIAIGEATAQRRGVVRALDARTGAQLWEADFDGFSEANLAVADGNVYVSGGLTGQVFAFDAETGQERWRYQAQYALYREPVAGGGIVMMATHSEVLAIDATTGYERWRVSGQWSEMAPWNIPAMTGEIVVVSQITVLEGVEAASGRRLWQTTTGGFELAPLVTAGGVAYVQTFDRALSAFDLQTGRFLWGYPLERIATRPAVEGGFVYVGTETGQLFAIGGTAGENALGAEAIAVTSGAAVEVVAEGAELRSAPSPVALVVKALPLGTQLTVTGEAEMSGGMRWWPVHVVETGETGYVDEAQIRVVLT
jgi:outer membrane protein assembly factor BamB